MKNDITLSNPFSASDALFNIPHALGSIKSPDVRAEYLSMFHRRLMRDIINVNNLAQQGKLETMNDDEKFVVCVAAGLPWSFQSSNGVSFYPTLDDDVGFQFHDDKVTIVIKERIAK